jgi:hypothetical protein
VAFPVNDERQPIGLPHPPAILIWIKETSSSLCLFAHVLAHARSPLLCRLVKDGFATPLWSATNLSKILTRTLRWVGMSCNHLLASQHLSKLLSGNSLRCARKPIAANDKDLPKPDGFG